MSHGDGDECSVVVGVVATVVVTSGSVVGNGNEHKGDVEDV